MFRGDILEWQTFWDSYESTVHTNTNLTDVQKFSYLKAQLESDAARTIEGFSLTNANYARAIDLLVERNDQKHKIIHATMQALWQLPAATNSLHSLRHFYDKMESYVRGLESMGQCQESCGNLLVPVLLDKLPGEIRKNLAREHGNSNWQIDELRKAIYKEINIIEAGIRSSQPEVEEVNSTASFYTGSKRDTRQRRASELPNSQPKSKFQLKCAFCGSEHSSTDCVKYKDTISRIDIVKKKKLCFNCLGTHMVTKCRSTKRCMKCNRKHHTSICKGPVVSMETNHTSQTATTPQPEATVLLSSTLQPHSAVLLKTAVATVCSKDLFTDSTILFDEGSQRSFITEALASELCVTRDGTETVCLSAFGGSNNEVQHLDKATVFIKTVQRQKIPISVLIVPTIATPIENRLTLEIAKLPHLKGLKLAHTVSSDSMLKISLLVGADFYWDIVEDKIVRGKGPTAVKSKIGYLLSGPVPYSAVKRNSNCVFNVVASRQSDEATLEKFWDLESIGISHTATEQDSDIYLKGYQQTSMKYTDGKYTARLPWKQDHPPLPSNYEVTLRRTQDTIRRLQKQPEIMKKYHDIIVDQEKRGFIEKVQEISPPTVNVHYIPHHPVMKESTTTPVRIVYDCSCRQSSDESSLNDCLESTPPNLNELTSILMRFRLNKYAVTTDIEKAFLHVRLHENDRDFTRFFWMEDPNDLDSPLVTYRFNAVLFGATCSPFMLNATLLKHLDMNKNVKAAKVIERDLYVDNVLSSFENQTEAVTYFREARTLMSAAGMNLRSWSSNSDAVRSEATKSSVLDTCEIIKVLGQNWEPSVDVMSFVKREIPTLKSVTKRTYSSQIYDPLGLLSPVTVRAKLLMQELWRQKFEWDIVLPEEFQQKWTSLADDLNRMTTLKIPRRLLEEDTNSLRTEVGRCFQLHIFVDASKRSYGAAAYLCENGQSKLIMAKNRVAPLKSLTLPQLELMAAVVGARLAKHIRNSIEIEDVMFWSDSQIVLYWLKTPGVDFAGPLYVKEKTGSESKAYVCLFTCAVTRAVHLEVLSCLSEDCFLQVFRRFISRRSLPKLMISDNATTFQAASSQIKRLFQSSTVKDTLSDRGTEWKFIPQRAPWYGGFWERLIGLTKSTLKKVLGRTYLNMESLQTVVTEIEAVMNDRPLTYTSSNSEDPDALTSSHLLQGRRMSSLPFTDVFIDSEINPASSHTNLTRRTKVQTQIMGQFWARWRREYLTALREYHRKSGSRVQTIQPGDVVQVHDDLPRVRWRLAVVEELIQGNDGLTRAAKVRTSSGVTTRPVVKLYPLEVIGDN